jgi:hypothetical protein
MNPRNDHGAPVKASRLKVVLLMVLQVACLFAGVAVFFVTDQIAWIYGAAALATVPSLWIAFDVMRQQARGRRPPQIVDGGAR